MSKVSTWAHPVGRRHVLLGGLGALAASRGWAQGTDNTPIRLVVPFTPGTGIDMIARQLGPGLTAQLKRPVFIENKAGAAGNIGTQEVARSAPDGSTLLVSVNTLVMNSALYPKLPFNPLTDLTPVCLTSWGQLILVASLQSGIDSLKALMTKAKARPGALNYGSPGTGTPHHLAMEMLKRRAGFDATHVPYRGGPAAMQDLLAGTLDSVLIDCATGIPFLRDGRARALLVLSEARSAQAPGVPTALELGIGQAVAFGWQSMHAPAATPAAVIDRLNRDLRDAVAAEAMQARMRGLGIESAPWTPAALNDFVAAENAVWRPLIRELGIRLDG